MKYDVGTVFPYIDYILVPISVQEVGLKGPKNALNYNLLLGNQSELHKNHSNHEIFGDQTHDAYRKSFL